MEFNSCARTAGGIFKFKKISSAKPLSNFALKFLISVFRGALKDTRKKLLNFSYSSRFWKRAQLFTPRSSAFISVPGLKFLPFTSLITDEVTFGAGSKQPGSTSNRSSQPPAKSARIERALKSLCPALAQNFKATYFWIITKNPPHSSSSIACKIIFVAT